MSRDQTIVEIFPNYGVVRGRLDPLVFKMANELPDKKQWHKGQLRFELTNGNLTLVRDRLRNATWKHNNHMPPATVIAKRLPITVNMEFSRPPRQGQAEAFTKLRELDTGALFMDMGTGKSYVAIHLAAWWWAQGLISRVLLIAPNQVERQWLLEQLPINAPPWFKWHGTIVKGNRRRVGPWIEELAEDEERCPWLCVNVELLSHERGLELARAFIAGGRTLVIIDESTRIKTPKSIRTKSITKFRDATHKRLILSGQPTTRGLLDLFAQYRFLDPDIIGTASVASFRQRYCVRGGYEMRQIVGYQNVEELLAKLEPYTFTMKKTSEYPPVYMTRHHDLNAEQRRMYKELKDDLYTWVTKAREAQEHDEEYGIACNNAAIALMRMQQVTCGYAQDRDEEGEVRITVLNTERAELTVDLIEEAGDQHVIIYCAFRQCIEMVKAELDHRLSDPKLPDVDKHRYTYIEVSGGVTGAQRSLDLDAFKQGKVMNMIGTAASGGIGLDLSVASTTIYYSNTNSSEHREQSKARTDRIGQRRYLEGRGVTYIDLIGSPVCKKIIEQLDTKKTITDLVMSLGDDELDLEAT